MRAKADGSQVFWLNVTGLLEMEGYSRESVQKREMQIRRIREQYRFDDMRDLKFPTTKLDRMPMGDGISQIGEYFHYIKPEAVILPDYNDIHSDHRYVFSCAIACTKSFRFPYIKYVLTMEILSETDFGLSQGYFVPTVYSDISQYLDGKIACMEIYDTELGEHPFPRSIENIKALAHIRGAESGCQYAEGFRLLKARI